MAVRYGVLETLNHRTCAVKVSKIHTEPKTSTPDYIVYGETGCYPIHVDIHTRMISYWAKLVLPENFNSLSSQIYLSARRFYNFSNITNISMYFKWVHSIKNLLDNAGFSGIWDSHGIINKTWLTKAFKQKMFSYLIGTKMLTITQIIGCLNTHSSLKHT